MAELAASNTGRQAEVADTDGVILESICKIVAALCHGTDEDANALLWAKILNVVPHTDNRSIKTEGDLTAVGRQVISDRVLDDLEKLFL